MKCKKIPFSTVCRFSINIYRWNSSAKCLASRRSSRKRRRRRRKTNSKIHSFNEQIVILKNILLYFVYGQSIQNASLACSNHLRMFSFSLSFFFKLFKKNVFFWNKKLIDCKTIVLIKKSINIIFSKMFFSLSFFINFCSIYIYIYIWWIKSTIFIKDVC